MNLKKTILSMLVIVAMSINSVVLAGCSACQAAAAARKSKQEALAAALAAGKPVSREMELDVVDFSEKRMIEACCEYCAKYGVYCGGANSDRCKACQVAKQSQQESLAAVLATIVAATEEIAKRLNLDINSIRAPRESLQGPCDEPCPSCNDKVAGCNCKKPCK